MKLFHPKTKQLFFYIQGIFTCVILLFCFIMLGSGKPFCDYFPVITGVVGYWMPSPSYESILAKDIDTKSSASTTLEDYKELVQNINENKKIIKEMQTEKDDYEERLTTEPKPTLRRSLSEKPLQKMSGEKIGSSDTHITKSTSQVSFKCYESLGHFKRDVLEIDRITRQKLNDIHVSHLHPPCVNIYMQMNEDNNTNNSEKIFITKKTQESKNNFRWSAPGHMLAEAELDKPNDDCL